jgi:hypothetical protein
VAALSSQNIVGDQRCDAGGAVAGNRRSDRDWQ